MNVLVTGGAGYIGSHAALRLLEDGHRVTVVDDLSRGHAEAIERLAPLGDLRFQEADLGDRAVIEPLLREQAIDAVMHFGAKAYVGESVEHPLDYYRNNAAAALGLIEAMEATGVDRMIFSSTCATYGEPGPEHVPIAEGCPQRPINPYGRSKLFVEHVLFDHARAKAAKGEGFAFAALRYFNVAGCDRDGRVGEDHDPETHLVPICLEVALGQRPGLTIFGEDYDTPDGTCIRDYVHVEDLIDAHVSVMDALRAGDTRTYNVGIGRGHSVREVIESCRRVTGAAIPAEPGPRRPGDPPELWAESTKVRTELGWSARYTDLDATVETAWRWKQAQPNGY